MHMTRSWALSGAIALLAATTVIGQAPAGAQGGRGRGQGPGGFGGFGGKTPTALRAIPAETTAAKVKDPNWKAPRTAWGHPDLEGVWTSDDMRSVQMSRAPQYGTRESLTAEEFAARASGDEGSRDRAVNQRIRPAGRGGKGQGVADPQTRHGDGGLHRSGGGRA
jgi:hypothetical protein